MRIGSSRWWHWPVRKGAHIRKSEPARMTQHSSTRPRSRTGETRHGLNGSCWPCSLSDEGRHCRGCPTRRRALSDSLFWPGREHRSLKHPGFNGSYSHGWRSRYRTVRWCHQALRSGWFLLVTLFFVFMAASRSLLILSIMMLVEVLRFTEARIVRRLGAGWCCSRPSPMGRRLPKPDGE